MYPFYSMFRHTQMFQSTKQFCERAPATPRNTAEDFADLFPKLTADEILIGER
jgi:hypothetical protein